MLGSHTETTMIYAHAYTEQKRRAIEKATPTDSPLKNQLNAEKYQGTNDEILQRLYGLKEVQGYREFKATLFEKVIRN